MVSILLDPAAPGLIPGILIKFSGEKLSMVLRLISDDA